MKSFNQAGQEVWVRQYLNNKKQGFFVDVGAYDGVESSNTYYLEKDLGWSGINIEANTGFYKSLLNNRPNCMNVNLAVMARPGWAAFQGINSQFVGNDIPIFSNAIRCDTLDSILKLCKAPAKIDYISMDIEGHEAGVLEGFPFNEWDVNLFTIEHNLYLIGPSEKEKIYSIMTRNGYRRVVENVLCPTGPYEDWYAKY